jgi:hypothetical protein
MTMALMGEAKERFHSCLGGAGIHSGCLRGGFSWRGGEESQIPYLRFETGPATPDSWRGEKPAMRPRAVPVVVRGRILTLLPSGEGCLVFGPGLDSSCRGWDPLTSFGVLRKGPAVAAVPGKREWAVHNPSPVPISRCARCPGTEETSVGRSGANVIVLERVGRGGRARWEDGIGSSGYPLGARVRRISTFS